MRSITAEATEIDPVLIAAGGEREKVHKNKLISLITQQRRKPPLRLLALLLLPAVEVPSRVYEAETDTGSDLCGSERIRSLQSGLFNGLLRAKSCVSFVINDGEAVIFIYVPDTNAIPGTVLVL